MTAAAHDASVLAVLAGTLLGVTGLDGMPHYVRTQTLPRGNPRPPAAVIQPTPCSQAYGQITANRAANGSPLPKFDGPHRRYGTCGYLPQQLNCAYGTDTTGYTGRGQTVGIVLWYASATQPADVNRFSRAHDWPQFRPGQYHQVLPGSFNQGRFCGGVQQEQAIDITSIRFDSRHGTRCQRGVLRRRQLLRRRPARRPRPCRARQSVIDNSWGNLLSSYTINTVRAYEQLF